jgi:hypothetical protein
MSNPADAALIDSVMNLIFGRWRSQSLYAGVKLGIFEVLHSAEEETLGLDPNNTYRLLRALGALDFPNGSPASTLENH